MSDALDKKVSLEHPLKAFRELQEATSAMFNKWREDAKEIREFEKESALLLANHGWYISSWMALGVAWKILAAARDGRIEDAEILLLDYFKTDSSKIRESLMIKYPGRGAVLSEAFGAHEKGMYFASTMLFLAQADGLCDGKIMSKDRKVKKYLDTQKSADLANTVLGTQSSIRAPYSAKGNYPSELNRHAVMHGLDNNYGTEMNSYRAMSLLTFIAHFVGRYNHWDPFGTARTASAKAL